MIPPISSALAGLQAYGTKIQSNSNNIANSNSDGFKKTRVVNQSSTSQGVEALVQKVETPGPLVSRVTDEGQEMVELSNVDLANELVDMNQSAHMYTANLKTIQVADEMIGTLLDIKS